MVKQNMFKRLIRRAKQWNTPQLQYPPLSIDLSEINLSDTLPSPKIDHNSASDSNFSFSDLLLEERLHRCWTQQEVADRLGTTCGNVSRWERGVTAPNPYFRQQLSSLFEKSPQALGLLSHHTPSKGAKQLNQATSQAHQTNYEEAQNLQYPSTREIGKALSYNDVDLSEINISKALPSSKIDHNTTTSISDPDPSLSDLLIEKSTTFPINEIERAKRHFQPIYVLYCYASQDRKLRDQLETHLMVLKRLKQITLRLNCEISAGVDWKEVQDERFHQADLILLLVSPSFIASDYHYGVEMHHALEKHKAGNVWVIPILLRPTSYWQQTPLGTLQILPQDGKAITDHPKRDQVLADVVRRIGEVVSLLLLKKYPSLHAGSVSKATQALGPFCISCGARNPLDVPVCENCGDVLL